MSTELHPTDEELLLLYNKGDSEAFNLLLDRYKGLIMSVSRQFFCRGITLNDLFQEGSIGLFKAVLRYDNKKGASFKNYAELCIRGHIINAIKHGTRIKHSLLNTSMSLDAPAYGDPDKSYLEGVASPDLNPEQLFIRAIEHSEREKHFQIFISNLSDLEKGVLLGRLNGCSHKEIAVGLEIHSKSVDNALTRIKKKITKEKTANPG